MKHRYTQTHSAMISVLTDARVSAGLSQRQLSALLKRSKTFVQTVESGERTLSHPEFIEYAQTLGQAGWKLTKKIEQLIESNGP